MKNLIETLRNQAVEIAKEGHAGWGNTMSCAADEIEKLDAEGARGRKTMEAMEKIAKARLEDDYDEFAADVDLDSLAMALFNNALVTCRREKE